MLMSSVESNGRKINFLQSMKDNEIRFLFAEEQGHDIKEIQVIFTGFTGLSEGLKELVNRTIITEEEANVYELKVITSILEADPELLASFKRPKGLLEAFKSLSDEGKQETLKFIQEKFPAEAHAFRQVLKVKDA